jgi:hypothetical protein
VFRVNVHANWRLIRTLDPLLRRAGKGRALFVTSGASSKANAYWSAYCASKAALDQMVRVWALELASTEVRANLLSPGATRTSMRANAFPGEDPRTVPGQLGRPGRLLGRLVRRLGLAMLGMGGFGHLHQGSRLLLNLVVKGDLTGECFRSFGSFHRKEAAVFARCDTFVTKRKQRSAILCRWGGIPASRQMLHLKPRKRAVSTNRLKSREPVHRKWTER